MLSVLKGVFLAITNSIFKYPSNVFWGASVPTLILFVNSASIYYKYNITNYTNLPSVVDIINSRESCYQFIFISLFSSFCILVISRYIQIYYRKSHQNSERSIKEKLNIYLGIYKFFAILYSVSFNVSTLLDISTGRTKKYQTIQTIMFLVMLMCLPFLHIIPRSIVKLKHPKRAIPGFSLIQLQTLSMFLALPFLVYSSIKGLKTGVLCSIGSFLIINSFLIGALSFVFDAMTLLGHRFIRFYLYVPKTKSTSSKGNRKIKLGV